MTVKFHKRKSTMIAYGGQNRDEKAVLVIYSRQSMIKSSWNQKLGIPENGNKSTEAMSTIQTDENNQERYDFEDCEDVKLYETYLVTTSNDKVNKFDRHSKHKLEEI